VRADDRPLSVLWKRIRFKTHFDEVQFGGRRSPAPPVREKTCDTLAAFAGDD
jgi:hypothetical protein